MSALSDYLQAHLGDRVADDVVREAGRQGHSIERSAVYSYLRGEHAKRPRQATLAALAAGFGVDVRVLRELAGRPAGELGPWVPTDESASLTRAQRAALDALIKVIVAKEPDNTATQEAPPQASAHQPTPDPRYIEGVHLPAAARHTPRQLPDSAHSKGDT